MRGNSWVKVLITIILLISIVVLGVFIYIQLNKKGVDTVIIGVEKLKEKNTPEQVQVKEKEPDLNKVIEEKPVFVDSEDEIGEDEPSIIVEKPIRREQEEIGNNDDTLQPDVMREPGTIIDEVSSWDTTDGEEQNENFLLEEKLKEKHLKESRNKGKLLAGLESALFQSFNGQDLETDGLFTKNIVVIPWYPREEISVEYMNTLNKLYDEFNTKLNILFVVSGNEDKVFVQELISNKGFTFKNYYDVATSYFASIEGMTQTEVIFVNKDDFIEYRFTTVQDENTLRKKFEEMVDFEVNPKEGVND